MKNIEERMSRLLTTELDEAVLTEQALMEAVDAADALLESNGYELKAEDLDSYIAGLQDILENYELSENDRAELTEIWRALVRGAGHVARGIGKTVGTYKKAKAAIGRAVAHVAGEYGAGHEAGQHSKAGPDEFEAPPAKPKKEKKPGFFSAAWKSGKEAGAEKAKKKLTPTPADVGIEKAAEALKAAQAKEKEKSTAA